MTLGLLAVSQAINALSGPAVPPQHDGGERAGLAILGVSAVVQLGSGLWLVPAHGLVGAVSAALGMVVWNGVGLVWVRRQHGFWMVSLANGWWRRA